MWLVKGKFYSPRTIRELRDLTRYKTKLTNQVSADRNRFFKILEDANIKLSVVLTDVFGATGKKMIKVILEEENYQPEKLLHLVHGKVKANREDIREALTGYVTAHHRFMLKTLLGNMERLQATITELEAQIEEIAAPYKKERELLAKIPGVGINGAVGIIAEIGVNMEQFVTHKHLAFWAGMCPGSNESAGKNKSGRITYGNKYLRALLTEQGWAASRSKNTYLGSKYKSLAGCRGKKKAIIAIGHKILIAAYFIIKEKVDFKELGEDYLNIFRKDKLINYYKKQLQKLDPNLVVNEKAA